jgi:hypothetical protein
MNFLESETVDSMLRDVRLLEGNFGDLRDDMQADMCCHIKALADDRDKLVKYIQELQSTLALAQAQIERTPAKSDFDSIVEQLMELRRQVRILSKTHPDTAVTWVHGGVTVYRELQDWANYVLGDEE